MLDELREQANSVEYPGHTSAGDGRKPTYHERRILGMTAFQRFVVSLLLFVIVCMLGIFFLMVTQRVVIPSFLLG